MPLTTYTLAGGGAVLAIVALVDGSFAAGVVAPLLFIAAYASHRRFAAFWWMARVFLAVCFIQAIHDAFRGPQTPMGIMCSVLAMLLTLLIASWWSRQRHHFSAARRDDVLSSGRG